MPFAPTSGNAKSNSSSLRSSKWHADGYLNDWCDWIGKGFRNLKSKIQNVIT